MFIDMHSIPFQTDRVERLGEIVGLWFGVERTGLSGNFLISLYSKK